MTIAKSLKITLDQTLDHAGLAQNTAAEICLEREDVKPDTFVLYGKNAEEAMLKWFCVDGVIDAVVGQDFFDPFTFAQPSGDIDHRDFFAVECFWFD